MLQNKYVLVTGATSGIGYELTKVFVQNSYNLVLIARSKEELQNECEELSSQFNIKAIPVAKDLFDVNAATELYEEVKEQGITVNISVNDAGQGVYGRFIEMDLQRQLLTIQLAQDGYEALMKGNDKVVSGLKNKAQAAVANVIPDTILAEQLRKQSEEI